ncbi:3979_t:CDS:1, partial [Acaulospora morrowiae]
SILKIHVLAFVIHASLASVLARNMNPQKNVLLPTAVHLHVK